MLVTYAHLCASYSLNSVVYYHKGRLLATKIGTGIIKYSIIILETAKEKTTMLIQWLGHACFKITVNGESLIIDPFEDGSVPGYRPIRESANMVLCSHMHHDHNAVGNVRLLPAGREFEVERLES